MPDVNTNFKGEPEKKKSIESKYAAWRKKVKQRDGNKCQAPGCGYVSKYNEAHHIASRQQRPDLRFVVSNGMTLCKKHHDWATDHPIEAAAIGLVSHVRYELARKGLTDDRD